MKVREWVSVEHEHISEVTWVAFRPQSSVGSLVASTTDEKVCYHPVHETWYELLSDWKDSHLFGSLFSAATATPKPSSDVLKSLMEVSSSVSERVSPTAMRLLSVYRNTVLKSLSEDKGKEMAAAAVCVTLFKKFQVNNREAAKRIEEKANIGPGRLSNACRSLIETVGMRTLKRVIQTSNSAGRQYRAPSAESTGGTQDKREYRTECPKCGYGVFVGREQYRQLYYLNERARIVHFRCGQRSTFQRTDWRATDISRPET